MSQLPAPCNFVYFPADKRLKWDEVPGAISYNIWIKKKGEDWPTEPINTPINSLSVELDDPVQDESKGEAEAPGGEWGLMTDPPEHIKVEEEKDEDEDEDEDEQ